jgi:CHAT domain-containing protein
MKFSHHPIFSLLCLTCSLGFIDPSFASQFTFEQGDTLIQGGMQHLNENQPVKALQLFNEAYTLYKKSNKLTGLQNALINQSVALQRMGQYYRACTTLTKLLSLNHEICQRQSEDELTSLNPQIDNGLDVNQQIAALHNLGNNLQLLGQLESSIAVIKQASRLAPNNPDITLSLANSYQAQYKDATNQLSISTDPASEDEATNAAQTQAQKAITLYKSLASKPSHRVYAQLNGLQLILHLGQLESSGLTQLHQQHKYLIEPFLSDLLSTDFNQFHDAEAVNLQLKLSGLLNELNKPTEAFHHARAALIKANALKDFRLRSQAYGTLGKLYRRSGQLDDATKVFTKALELAQASKEDSLAYQWAWQIAQIYQQQGERPKAIAAYDTSIQHLDRVRTILVSANSDLQFNYQESVEPVYQGYLKLLLSSPTPNLQLVLETHQQLQVAELENFLKCGKLTTAQFNNQLPSYSSTIHIFYLDGQIEVIAQTQKGIFRHRPNSSIVQQELFKLLTFFDGASFEEIPEEHFKRNAQTLYSQLISPLQEHIPPTGDLLFVLDSKFQNLPLSLLHDGQYYLIEKYTVTNALNTSLQQRHPQSINRLKVLFAGLSEDSPSFNKPNVPSDLQALPEVKDELREVQKVSKKITSLINSDFTTDRLKTAINQDMEILHVASHGQFSSDPQKTFLLAYNQPINAQEFHDLLNQKSEIGQASLELLILSACQTAKGDKRSTLGIAGLAIQAGSKNTLASLWLAESGATTELITSFYQGLNNGLSKAKALQQAQIKLLKSQEYWHPYFWGNFILVGS